MPFAAIPIQPLARAPLIGDAREPGKLRRATGEPAGALRRREEAAVGQALGAPPGVLGGRTVRDRAIESDEHGGELAERDARGQRSGPCPALSAR